MNRTTILRSGALVAIALATGLACQAQTSGVETTRKARSPVESSFRPLGPGQLGADRIPGYRHTLGASKFWLGQKGLTPQVESDGTYTRHVGPDGAFFELPNGFAAGVPNALAPSTQVAPYSNEPTAHTAFVMNYFKERGIPQDQLGEPSLTTQMRGVSQTSDGKEIERQHVGYTTILHRKVAGCPVPDSHAWARFNKNGDVVAEQVWWPELPGSVSTDADAFRSMLADGSGAATFRSKLPPEFAEKPGTLTIHHTTPMGEFWRVWVGYDLRNPLGYACNIHRTPKSSLKTAC